MSLAKKSYHLILADSKIWTKDDIIFYLYECLQDNTDPVIDSNLEGSCCRTNGLYRLLDKFCAKTGMDPSRITIRTANMIEHHDLYKIEKVPSYWYEVTLIQQWAERTPHTLSLNPTKHFSNFVGRSSWYRLWIATILNNKFNDQTLQTYNSGIRSNYVMKEDTGLHDYLGLEELAEHECDILPKVMEFLETCPIYDSEEIEYVKTVTPFIPQNDYYPIQHPANLNILKKYNDVFVDVICETRARGNVFFVTEKTWRCIIAKRPFIMMSSVNFLENFKKLGFKTFGSFWDENYDELGMQYRVKHIEEVLETISKWSVDEIKTKLAEMQEILDHNYDTFMSLTYDKINEVFKKENQA